MVMIQHSSYKTSYSMDGYLHDNLSMAKNIILKDWDMIFCIDGPEGSGKSVLGQQVGYFCDPTIDLSRIVFTANEFRKAVVTAKPYQAIIYDEAYTGLNSRAAMSFINRALVEMLAEIRQKNLFIIVIMPTFFDLDKYVALWRSRVLLHVYIGDNFERGYFAFYNVDLKKQLYILGKKFYSYAQPKPNFVGRFPNFYVVDEAQYKKKKRDALMAREQKASDNEVAKQLEQELFIRLQETKVNPELTHSVKMQLLAMPSATYFRKLKQYQQMRAFS